VCVKLKKHQQKPNIASRLAEMNWQVRNSVAKARYKKILKLKYRSIQIQTLAQNN